MKTDPALLARLIETTRHFWGLGVSPLKGESVVLSVDADQPDGICAGYVFVAEQSILV